MIVYGIIDILELFTGSFSPSCFLEISLNDATLCVESYLLVITSRSEVGHGELFRSCFLTLSLRSFSTS